MIAVQPELPLGDRRREVEVTVEMGALRCTGVVRVRWGPGEELVPRPTWAAMIGAVL